MAILPRLPKGKTAICRRFLGFSAYSGISSGGLVHNAVHQSDVGALDLVLLSICLDIAACASSFLAMINRPDVSLSSLCTMPGLISPPMVESALLSQAIWTS